MGCFDAGCILPIFLLAQFILTTLLKWATTRAAEYSLSDQIKKGGVPNGDDKCKCSGFEIVRCPDRYLGQDTDCILSEISVRTRAVSCYTPCPDRYLGRETSCSLRRFLESDDWICGLAHELFLPYHLLFIHQSSD